MMPNMMIGETGATRLLHVHGPAVLKVRFCTEKQTILHQKHKKKQFCHAAFRRFEQHADEKHGHWLKGYWFTMEMISLSGLSWIMQLMP